MSWKYINYEAWFVILICFQISNSIQTVFDEVLHGLSQSLQKNDKILSLKHVTAAYVYVLPEL